MYICNCGNFINSIDLNYLLIDKDRILLRCNCSNSVNSLNFKSKITNLEKKVLDMGTKFDNDKHEDFCSGFKEPQNKKTQSYK